MKRGLTTIADLRAHSRVDLRTHCWHWQGALATDGTPRMWAFDHERCEKRAMSGPKAVWNIAHGQAPNGLPFRACVCTDCVNPAHLKLARSKAEIGAHIALAGTRKGTFVEQRRANIRKAWATAGTIPTPPEIVLAVKAAQGTNVAVAARFGLGHRLVSAIRLGKSHRTVTA